MQSTTGAAFTFIIVYLFPVTFSLFDPNTDPNFPKTRPYLFFYL